MSAEKVKGWGCGFVDFFLLTFKYNYFSVFIQRPSDDMKLYLERETLGLT